MSESAESGSVRKYQSSECSLATTLDTRKGASEALRSAQNVLGGRGRIDTSASGVAILWE